MGSWQFVVVTMTNERLKQVLNSEGEVYSCALNIYQPIHSSSGKTLDKSSRNLMDLGGLEGNRLCWGAFSEE